MCDSLLIRPVNEQDRTVYTQLMEEFYNTDAVLSPLPPSFHQRTFDELMKNGPYLRGFLFEKEGQIAGFGQISFRYGSEAGGIECWFEDLYVKEAFRCLGIGGRFMDYVMEHFPAPRYRLEAEEGNPRAIALYKKKGFSFLPYKQMICDRKDI